MDPAHLGHLISDIITHGPDAVREATEKLHKTSEKHAAARAGQPAAAPPLSKDVMADLTKAIDSMHANTRPPEPY